MDIGGLVLDAIKKLVLTALSRGALAGIEGVLKRRKIEHAVEAAVLEVVEPLAHFLEIEKITDPQRQILIQAAELALTPLVEEPARLFAGSLEGTRIAEQILAVGHPRDIRDEQLEDLYALLLPRMATVLCKLLPVVDEWRVDGWREGFRRLDDIAEQLRHVLARLDAQEQRVEVEADVLLASVRRSIVQRVTLQMDLTALRSDAVKLCDFEKMFVRPEIVEIVEMAEQSKSRRSASNEAEVAQLLLAPSMRALVVGAPGSGKSTWLRWLERVGNDTCWPGIVVRVELRGLVQKAELPAWMELLQTAMGAHLASELEPSTAKRWRDEGRLAFLIDGFDEVPSDRRDAVRTWLIDLASAAVRCPILVTSRPLTTEHLDTLTPTWSRWTIEDFDDDRIIAYISRWYEHAELPVASKSDIDAKALAKQWTADPTIQPLTGNPLLLATLLLVHVLDGSLPAGRSKLYQRYVEGMLGIWDNRHQRAVSVQLTREHKHEILRDIAVRMFLGNIDQIEDKEICEIIARTLQRLGQTAEPEQVLEFLRERTGLLIGPEIYTFSHKSVAEFLVAETIVEGSLLDDDGARIDRMRLFRHRYDDRWNTVLFLWAGLARKAELEQFIRETASAGTLECWRLVFGLLDDQFSRVDPEFWVECVSGLDRFGPMPRGGLGYVCDNFDDLSIYIFIDAPTFWVRGLRSEHVGIVLARAWNAGYLFSWEKSVVNPALRWLLATRNLGGNSWEHAALSVPDGWDFRWSQVAIAWVLPELWRLTPTVRAQRLHLIEQSEPRWRERLLTRSTEKSEFCELDFLSEVAASADLNSIPDQYFTLSDWGFDFNSRIILDRLRDSVSQGLLPDDEVSRRAIANLEALDARVTRLRLEMQSKR